MVTTLLILKLTNNLLHIKHPLGSLEGKSYRRAKVLGGFLRADPQYLTYSDKKNREVFLELQISIQCFLPPFYCPVKLKLKSKLAALKLPSICCFLFLCLPLPVVKNLMVILRQAGRHLLLYLIMRTDSVAQEEQQCSRHSGKMSEYAKFIRNDINE